MRAEFWAVLTAVFWACGSFYEKKFGSGWKDDYKDFLK